MSLLSCDSQVVHMADYFVSGCVCNFMCMCMCMCMCTCICMSEIYVQDQVLRSAKVLNTYEN